MYIYTHIYIYTCNGLTWDDADSYDVTLSNNGGHLLFFITEHVDFHHRFFASFCRTIPVWINIHK